MITSNRAIDNAMIGLSRVYLSSLISMLLLVKAMVLKRTLVVISRVVTLVVQTFESVRARCTSCSCLLRGVILGIGLTTPSQ